MKNSVYYAQTSPVSIGIPIPIQNNIVPVLLPGVEIPSDGCQVRVDVNLLIEATSTVSGLSLEYQVILVRDDQYVCSRHLCHTQSHGTETDIVLLPLSFYFTDVPPAGKVTYSLELLANPHITMKAQNVLLQDCSISATVSKPTEQPLPKDALIVSNSKMGSLFLCTPTKLERSIPTGQTFTAGEWLPDGSAFYGVDVTGYSTMIKLEADTSRLTHVLPPAAYGEPLVSSDSRNVYIADETGVTKLNTKSHDMKRLTLSQMEKAPCLALNRSGSLLFVGLQDSGILVVETENMKKLDLYPVKEANRIQVTPDGAELLAMAGNDLVFVSLATGITQRKGIVESLMAGWALSSRLNMLFVMEDNQHLQIVDLKTKKLFQPLKLPYSPMRFIYLDDNRGRLYVPQWDDHSLTSYLSVVDLSTRSLMATEPIRPGLLAMLSVKGDRLWVSMLNRILILEPETLEFQDEILTGLYPFNLHFRP